MITRRILFNTSVTLADGTTFEAGRVYELPGPSAQRWIVRNKAEEVSDAVTFPEKEPEAAAAPVSLEDDPVKPPAPPVNKATTKAPKKKLKKKSVKK